MEHRDWAPRIQPNSDLKNTKCTVKKSAIERFIQVVFSVWRALLLLEMEYPDGNVKEKNNKRNHRQNQTIGDISPHNR